MSELEMIPTNGKCPDGIDGKFVWLQDVQGNLTCTKFNYGDCIVTGKQIGRAHV